MLRVDTPRGIDRLKQRGIEHLDPRQYADHGTVGGLHYRKIETYELKWQCAPVRSDDGERAARVRYQRDRLDLPNDHLQRPRRTARHRDVRDAIQPAQPIREQIGIVEHARLRRQPQRREHLIGIEVADADELDLLHAEKRQTPQHQRCRRPGSHHHDRRARPPQHAP